MNCGLNDYHCLEKKGIGLQVKEHYPNHEAQGGSIMLRGCFAPGGTSAKIDCIMRKKDYVQSHQPGS